MYLPRFYCNDKDFSLLQALTNDLHQQSAGTIARARSARSLTENFSLFIRNLLFFSKKLAKKEAYEWF